MKRNGLMAVLLMMAFVLTGCGLVKSADIKERLDTELAPVIHWGVKADTKLFGYYNIEAGALEGFDIDIAKALTDVLTDGRGRADFTEVTSKTRTQLLRNGNIDAIIATMTITPARLEVIDFSDVYYMAGQALLVPESSHLDGLDTITKDDTIIVIKGSTSARNIQELAPQAQTLELENYAEGFVALRSKQGDALTTDNTILMGMIQNIPGYRIGKTFTEEPYGIGIAKSQTAFKDAVNQALSIIKANGVYDAIYDKWFGQFVEKE